MIGQYLSNRNESATVPKILKFYQLNKALALKAQNKMFKVFRRLAKILDHIKRAKILIINFSH
jgi:hypothetical protein